MAYYNTGSVTASAGTEITAICPPNGDKIAMLRGFVYECAGTEHDMYVIRCRGTTTTSSFTAAADATMEIAKTDPGHTSAAVDEDLAAADWIAYETEYGNLEVRKVSSISASTLTLASGPTDDVNEGAKVYAFYEAATANIGAVHIRLDASATSIYDNLNIQGGIPHQDGIQESVPGSAMPILIVIDNVTAQGYLDQASFEWIDKGNDFSK